MTNPSDLREPSNNAIRNDRTHAFEYNSYYYEAIGFISGITHERRNHDVYDSHLYWEHASSWCDYYAGYMIRCNIHKHEPLSISVCYNAFVAFELPLLHNAAATTPCEVDNA